MAIKHDEDTQTLFQIQRQIVQLEKELRRLNDTVGAAIAAKTPRRGSGTPKAATFLDPKGRPYEYKM